MNLATFVTSLNAFFTAAGQIANAITVLAQHNFEKDKELKDAKQELTQEWHNAMASKDKSRVLAILQRVRDQGGD